MEMEGGGGVFNLNDSDNRIIYKKFCRPNVEAPLTNNFCLIWFLLLAEFPLLAALDEYLQQRPTIGQFFEKFKQYAEEF